MDQVADGITVEIPEIMIERQARQFIENIKAQVYQQGIGYEQYLKMTNTSEEKLLADAREPSEKQVRMDLAVTAIIDAEKLEATEDDIEEEYKKLAEQSAMDVESLKKYVNHDQIRDQVLTRKAIAVVTDSATATAPETANPEA